MFFSVALGGASPNFNSTSRRESTIPGTGEKYAETAYMQTPEEHQALLDQFKGVKGIPPELAEALGKEAEAKSPRYWHGDAVPRYGGSTPSSSFITGISVQPGLGLVGISMNGKTYSYALPPDKIGELLNANSIGAAYNIIKNGKSNIPVQVTSRSGALEGPAQFKEGLGKRFAFTPDSGMNALASVVGPAAAIGLISGLAKMYGERKDRDEEI